MTRPRLHSQPVLSPANANRSRDRYRVVLDRRVREFLKVKPRSKVLTIPFSEGVLIILLQGKNFNTSLPGFRYGEQAHEASRFLFKKN
jgi:hypothetical protein